MKKNHLFSYLLLLIGAIIAIYARAEATQNTIVLFVGIVFLMYGTYRLSSTIPSKTNKEDQSFIEEEKEEE